MYKLLQRLKFLILLLIFLGKLNAQNCEHIGLVGAGFLVGQFDCEKVIITFDSAMVLQPANRLAELSMGSFVQFSYEVLDSVGCSPDIPLVTITCLDTYTCNFEIESTKIDTAETTTFQLEIFNQTDFGPYHPQIVKWYEYETNKILGNDPIISYQAPPNSLPVVTICADFEVSYSDSSFCSGTICEALIVEDILPEVTDCQAFFGYLPHGPASSGKIDFFNYSFGPYSQATWDFGDGQSLIANSEMLSHTFENPGLYNVCLTLSAEANCTSTFCLPVFTISGPEICNYNDCVLPGDANKDSTVNIFDVLSLGLAFNTMGEIRPNAVLDPILQAAFDWSFSIGNLNYKHIDCDGNGLIEEADFAAIDQNYIPIEGKTELPEDAELPFISLKFEKDTLYIPPNQSSIQIPATLSIGPITDLYGVALSLNYNGAVASIETTYDENSFLGIADNILAKQKNLVEQQQLGLAITRTNQLGINGSGNIATVSFIVEGDIIEGRVIELELNDLKAINSSGEIIPVSTDENNSTVTIIADSTLVHTTNQLSKQQLEVYPNPTNEQINISISKAINLSEGRIEVFNALGQQVHSQALNQHEMLLELKNQDSGLYWVKIHTKTGIGVRAIIIGD